MSPPVRDAVQGAYVVAAFFTGITFGGLAIVFKELAEGFGCLLGGFCFSMWLLALKPGGLLTEAGSKAGFIGAIAVGLYSLSFSHYTRHYGLIVTTAISGGTAFTLGVDCYSRAGLKEFWLYLWGKIRALTCLASVSNHHIDLNDDIFPLGTKTYPLTRGIRVELAVIIIVSVMGVVCQLRLWNVVKQRKLNEKKRQDKEQQKKDAVEVEVGRRLQNQNEKDREAWEAIYGHGPGTTDTSTTDVPDDLKKCRTATRAVETEADDAIQMDDIEDSSRRSPPSDHQEERENQDESSRCSVTPDGTQARDGQAESESDDPTKQSSGSETPPAKFVDRAAIAARNQDDNDSDASAIAGSETGSPRLSRHFSRRSIFERLSRGGAKAISQSEEALVPRDSVSDIDSLSSREALRDDISDFGFQSSAIVSNIDDGINEDGTEEVGYKDEHSGNETTSMAMDNEVAPEDKTAERVDIEPEGSISAKEESAGSERHSDDGSSVTEPGIAMLEAMVNESTSTSTELEEPTIKSGSDERGGEGCKPEDQEQAGEEQESPTELLVEGQTPGPGGVSSSKTSSRVSPKAEKSKGRAYTSREDAVSTKRGSSGSRTKSSRNASEKAKLNAESVKELPERTSKIVQTYRTNEWAKHLSEAETPEAEPITPLEEDQPEGSEEAEEVAAPVNASELLQTPLNAQPPPIVESHPQARNGYPNEDRRISNPPDQQTEARMSDSQINQVKPPTTLARMPSASSSRVSLPSQPPPPTLKDMRSFSSPYLSTAPNLETTWEEDEPPSPDAAPKWNGPPPLMAVREGMVRSRSSLTVANQDPWASRNPPGQNIETGKQPSPPFSIREEDEEDLPLSQRRAMLHRQKSQTNVAHAGLRGSRSQSFTPQRNSSAAMLAWRQSVLEDLSQRRDPLGLGDRRQSLSGLGGQYSPSINVEAPRGGMTDSHREVMRRMQAAAYRRMS